MNLKSITKYALVFIALIFLFSAGVSAESEGIEVKKNTSDGEQHKITLSLRKADLLDVLNMLAKKTKWNLVIGKEVSGEVSLNLNDVSIEDALAAVVRVGGYAIERKKDILYVTEPEKMLGLPFPEETEHKTYRLAYGNVLEAAEVIQNYLSPYGKLTIHKLTDTLFIEDISETFSRIEPILLELDQPLSQVETVNKTYRLSHINAAEAAEIIKSYLSPHGKLTVHKSSDTLLIEDISENLTKIETIIHNLDRPSPPKKLEFKAYRLSSTDLNAVAKEIRHYLSPHGKLTLHNESDTLFIEDIPESLIKIETIIKDLEQPLAPKEISHKIYSLSYIKAVEAEKVIRNYLSPYGKISFHKESDTLFIDDTPEVFTRIESILKELDKLPKQVMIEAKIFEVTLNDALSYGVDWNMIFSPSNLTEKIQTQGLSKTSASDATGFFFSLAGSEITLVLDALQEDGALNTLATPKLLALNHKPAKIVIGGRLGFRVTTTTNLVTQESIEFLDIGTQLSLTPHIDNGGNILMEIHPEISDGVVTEGLPSKTTTEVTTTLMAKDGESIFIGGLIRERQEEVIKRVPILGYIPILNFFFSRTETKTLKSEIVVVITPHLAQQQVSIPASLE